MKNLLGKGIVNGIGKKRVSDLIKTASTGVKTPLGASRVRNWTQLGAQEGSQEGSKIGKKLTWKPPTWKIFRRGPQGYPWEENYTKKQKK